MYVCYVYLIKINQSINQSTSVQGPTPTLQPAPAAAPAGAGLHTRGLAVERRLVQATAVRRSRSSCYYYYALPLIGGGIKRCFCLVSVANIGPNSRTEIPMKTKIGTEVAHVTRDSDTTFKVKGQGHQAALLSAALTCKAAAAVSMGTYSAYMLRCVCSAARDGGSRWVGAYCVSTYIAC